MPSLAYRLNTCRGFCLTLLGVGGWGEVVEGQKPILNPIVFLFFVKNE